jgi:MoxR-like ATPase
MKPYEKFLKVEQELNGLLVERNEPIRGIILATIAQLNLLLLGPAGVAKSALIRQWNKRITDSVYFEWLLTKFSSPEDLFGPPSFTALDQDKYIRNTDGKLPQANTAFIDEIFKGNSSILNAMLTILNERIFFNDNKPTKLDLYTVAGASNEVPDADDNLDAFYDRFLLKYHVEYIKEDGHFLDMLEGDLDVSPTTFITKKDIQFAQLDIQKIEFSKEMQSIYVKLRKNLRVEGFSISDRTYKVALRLLRAQAWLSGRDSIDTPDFEILKHIVWTHPDQKKKAQSQILEIIAPEKNRVYEILENCRQVNNKVFEKKTSKERHDAALEALSKLKDGSKEVGQLKNVIAKRGTNIEEVERVEKEIESMKKHLLVEELGVDKLIK